MAVSTDTIFKLTDAVERLATNDGSSLHRAQQALAALAGVNSAEFADDVAGIPWSYVASKSKAIREETAESSEVSKFNSSIWQLFNAYRPK
ncbi:hypothetical protein [Pseudomonas sp. 210_17 TE3656]